MHKHFSLITLIFLHVSCLHAVVATPPPDALTFLRTSHRLDLLYTSLYGQHHPFKRHVANFEHLTYMYAKLNQQKQHSNRKQQDTVSEMHTTLSMLNDYIIELLDKYELNNQPFSRVQLPPNALPQPNRPLPQLAITPARNVVTTEIDQAVQELVAADNAVSSGGSKKKQILKDQLGLLSGGIIFIIVFTVIGRYLVTPSLREVLSKASKITARHEQHQTEIKALTHELSAMRENI